MCYSAMVRASKKKLAAELGAHWDEDAFDAYELKAGAEPKKYKPAAIGDESYRIYPKYYAPLILWENGRRVVRPYRYRLLPSWAKKEFPSNINTFNARLDSLATAPSWKPIFMKRHGLLCFERFYEWVADKDKGREGKSKLISFVPDRGVMWAPCIWDRWTDGTQVIESFAMVTTDPPSEVKMMGHDRCPVFLKHELIDEWLRPAESNRKRIYEILNTLEDVTYSWEWAAAA